MQARAWIVIVIGAVVCAPASAQDGAERDEPPAYAVRVETAPVIDGKLDDEVWELAQPFEDFLERTPSPGQPPSERTVVRIVYDDDNLYVGIRAYDSEPNKISARSMRHDTGGGDDTINVTLDPNLDRRTGYDFGVMAGGGRREALIDSQARPLGSWDGIWEARTSVDDEGWTAEMRIPFKTISLDRNAPAWGLNVGRGIARRAEGIIWRNARRDGNVYQVAQSGRLEGIENPNQGIGLSLKPYLVTRINSESDDVDVEPALDIFYRLTSQITAAITINTDFADTDVDDRIVNLTRFPLFFPEKRDFFLEDADIFDYGGIRRSPLPFYSRRIGLVGGEIKPILAGVRVTGRQGPWRFGVMDVQMKDDDVLGSKNLAVVRAQRDVGDESSLGFILTNGDPATTGNNTLFGADLALVNTNAFGGTGRTQVNLWAQGTYTDSGDPASPASNDDSTAIGGRVSVERDPWEADVFLARVGEDYDPALGFANRAGRTEFSASGEYTWWMPDDSEYIRNVSVEARVQGYVFNEGDLEELNTTPIRFDVTSQAGDRAFVSLRTWQDIPGDDFEIVDGVIIPAGDYQDFGGIFGFRTSEARRFDVSGDVIGRTFYDGQRYDFIGGLGFRPGPVLNGRAEFTHTDVSIPGGDFNVNVLSTRASIQFSPDMVWDNTIQWDNQSSQAGFNSRWRWEFRPGQELIVVYNQGFDVDGWEFESTEQVTTIKAALTFRF